MTSTEFDMFCRRIVPEYAGENIRAGIWSVDEAENRSLERVKELLPDGVRTEGMLMLTAEGATTNAIGQVWVALSRLPGAGDDAWIYFIEIIPQERGKGYGRTMLRAVELEIARHGANTIGLNVFGRNTAARSLYESAGYEPVSIQMRKTLKDR